MVPGIRDPFPWGRLGDLSLVGLNTLFLVITFLYFLPLGGGEGGGGDWRSEFMTCDLVLARGWLSLRKQRGNQRWGLATLFPYSK